MQIKKIDRSIDKGTQKQYHSGKEVLEFNDVSGLPKGIREAMIPLTEHARKIAIGTIEDALAFVENPRAMDAAIVKERLQKLLRLLRHIEGESDANIHSAGPHPRNSKREVLGSPVEFRGMDSRRTEQEGGAREMVLARLEHARRAKGKIPKPGVAKGRKV